MRHMFVSNNNYFMQKIKELFENNGNQIYDRSVYWSGHLGFSMPNGSLSYKGGTEVGIYNHTLHNR